MKAWQKFLDAQEKRLGSPTVDKWLRPLQVVRFDAYNLYLEAEDPFHIHWFQEHIAPQITQGLLSHNQKPIRIHLSLKNELPLHPHKLQAERQSSESGFPLEFDAIDPLCTFSEYLSQAENRVPYQLLTELASYDPENKQPKQGHTQLGQFNPIYLFGEEGIGKTHLLMAVASALKGQGLRVLYVRADTFTDHLVNAIRIGEMQLFRRAYRDIDVLLVDDVQVLGGRAATQEEFFHTFNTLHLEEKQILLGANCAPGELKQIEPRLVSRFEWGITLPLVKPSPEHLKQILIKRLKGLDYTIQEDTALFLLSVFNQTKSLLKAVNALVLRTHTAKEQIPLPLSKEHAQHLLKDLIYQREKEALTAEKIIRLTAEHYGIRVEDILGKSQNRECVTPRQVAMHFCRKQLNLPLKKIGLIFSRDHSTVLSSIRNVEKCAEQKTGDIPSALMTLQKQF